MTDTTTPLVSIVLPVYNGARHLIDAVASLLEQSFTDWELICIDDGSRDATPQILHWFAEQDRRIRVIRQANQGIVAALNHGCEIARAPLLARMDADDIALPERLERQVAWFEEHPECVALGTAILEIDADGDPLCVSTPPQEHEVIEATMLHRGTGLFHPTVMMRAESWRAVGGYRSKFQWVEDHDLWLRLAQWGQLANLSDVLLAYRQHAGSVCWTRADQQRRLMNQLLREAYAARGRSIPAGVLQDATRRRSAAGPGKWARSAAKGGFVRSAIKHLGNLVRETAPITYKVRMCLEVALRIAIWACRSGAYRGGSAAPSVPQFATWYQRWYQSAAGRTLPEAGRGAEAA